MATIRFMAQNPDSDSLSPEEILASLSTKARQLEGLRTTDIKYPTLHRILISAIQEMPPDTRLPGIRDLADCLGISLVTVQKTISKLVADGVLYSKPRSGVFVLNPQQAKTGAASPGAAETLPEPHHPFRALFTFGTDSRAPFQKKFWEKVADRFCQQYPNTEVEIHFGSDSPSTNRPLDAYERYDWTQKTSDLREGLLDVAAFGGNLLPDHVADGRLVPLYYRTYFLFYNDSLCERHHFPLPSYRTFADQAAYFQGLAPALTQAGLNPRPYSIQEPVTLLGSWGRQFSSLFETDTIDAKKKQELVSALDQLIRYCQICRYYLKGYSPDDWIHARNEFIAGKSPFFLGYSVDYWEFTRKKLPFNMAAYPTLCVDNSFFLWTRAGAVAKNSEHPVESVNFLSFLLRDEVQKEFAATGHYGASLSREVQPAMNADPEWTRDVLGKCQPLQLPTKELHYLTINILGGEIWRSLIQPTTGKEILERSLQLGRAYLRHRPR